MGADLSVDDAYKILAAGDAETAEPLLRQRLARDPDEPETLYLLGYALFLQRRMAEAEDILKPLAARGSSATVLGLLAYVQYLRRAYAACEATLERLADEAPASITVEQILLLAKLKNASGRDAEALAVTRRGLALHPDNADLVVALSDRLMDTPDQAYAVLEAALSRAGDNGPVRSYYLKRLTSQRVRALRTSRGLEPTFGVSWTDTCAWSDPEGLVRLQQALIAESNNGTGSARGGAFLDLACVAIAKQNWPLAESMLAHVRNNMPGTFADCFALGAAFHAELEKFDDAAIGRGLPAIQYIVQRTPQSDTALFLASDPVYFKRFTLPFLTAFEKRGVAADVQVHLLDGADGDWSEVARDLDSLKTVRASLSAEASDVRAKGMEQAKVYYHAVRFIRLYQALQRTLRPTWILDVDVNLMDDPRPTFSRLSAFDLAMRSAPQSFEPSLKLMAGCFGVAPTPRGLEFARRLAAYIAYWKNDTRWAWGVDQLGMFSVYAHMHATGNEPKTLFLGPDVICGVDSTSAVFQFPAGLQKFAPAAAVK